MYYSTEEEKTFLLVGLHLYMVVTYNRGGFCSCSFHRKQLLHSSLNSKLELPSSSVVGVVKTQHDDKYCTHCTHCTHSSFCGGTCWTCSSLCDGMCSGRDLSRPRWAPSQGRVQHAHKATTDHWLRKRFGVGLHCVLVFRKDWGN